MSVASPAAAFPSPSYTRVTTIAQGGMGYVELVFRREGRFLRWCARKRLHEQYRTDPTFRSMFMDEARLAGLVRHPNAVGVLDVGVDEDGPFLIMDFVEGVSLSRLIADAVGAGRDIPMQVAVRICMDAARGLHAAHEVRAEDGTVLRLVHRDVSPQNILIGFDGTVRVTDFGIAKALGNSSRTSVGVLKGNMGYVAPEQLRFEEPDRRSDFFSLGVTLYELLSGRRLYPNKTGFDGTRRILTEPPPDIGEVRNDVPPELCELLFEMLAKERDSRPATAAEVASRLEGILAVLIAEEGSLTVADYMGQHFASQCQEQRAILATHLKRIESEPQPTLRTISAVGDSVVGAVGAAVAVRQRNVRLRIAGVAATALVGVMVIVWSRGVSDPPLSRRSEPSNAGVGPGGGLGRGAPGDSFPAPIPGPTSPRGSAAVSPSAADAPIRQLPVALASPPGLVQSVSAPGAATGRVHRKGQKRPARPGRTGDQAKGDGNRPSAAPDRLSVPLFERWQ